MVYLKTRIRKLKNNNRKITVKNGIKKHGKGHSLCTKNRNEHFALQKLNNKRDLMTQFVFLSNLNILYNMKQARP